MPAGRYQRWINTHIISAALDRVRDEDGEPLFTLKGGAAMELRLGLRARASKDYDAAFRARAEDMLDAVDRALVEDWHGFQLRAKHAWPPQVTTWPSWADGFAAMARDVALYTEDVEIAAADLRSFISEIDAA
jgi:hypothetical protein